ncbi:MAG: GDSL-type esterase/lipase family protein [bacterium]
MITQIFIVGSSNVYGVGAEQAGWADLLKQKLHKKMYSENGLGEKFEIYNLGKSGATIDFVKNEYPKQLHQYYRGGDLITIVSVGGNNSKAIGRPDNFVSTLEKYETEMIELLDQLKKLSTHVIVVGSGYFDESKTNPIFNPDIGGNSYFQNSRKKKFEAKLRELAEQRGITFVEISVSEEEWKAKYLFRDGLHPNQQGHQLISDLVYSKLQKIIREF